MLVVRVSINSFLRDNVQMIFVIYSFKTFHESQYISCFSPLS